MAHQNLLSPTGDAHIAALLGELLKLRAEVMDSARRRLATVEQQFGIDPAQGSAANLAYYLALREHDLREIQDALSQLGLSSLGRGEARVLDNLNQVIAWLSRAGHPPGVVGLDLPLLADAPARALLNQRTNRLFGASVTGRRTRVMVTLPSEAAWNYDLVRQLLENGMDLARINCAHDDRATWRAMIANVRHAAEAMDRECRILMDLAGPKIRTGPVARRPAVRKLSPRRDAYGQVSAPCEVLLVADGTEGAPAVAHAVKLPLPEDIMVQCRAGDRLAFRDTRGKTRHIYLTEPAGHESWLGNCFQSARLAAGCDMILQRRPGDHDDFTSVATFPLPEFPGEPVDLPLFSGERLRLTGDLSPGTPARRDPDTGKVIEPASIGCVFPGLVGQLQPGQAVWFDDGKLGAVVEEVEEKDAILRITESGGRQVRLKADKGINFPGAHFAIPALTPRDRADLEFVCAHSDMLALSFVRSPQDVETLLDAMDAAGTPDHPLVLKIETREAVEHLPHILFRIAERPAAGVMIARGDLAVEIGPVRLAEMQEEILWLCEAAHLPVIWATEVLNTLAKKGITSRPEITDAAMGSRAECVMLNKGPRIGEAVRTLAEILTRMEAHQRKKSSLLRALHW